ncbi:MAG: lysoplasmalogenase [Gemmatimonadota bacterium]|jgi:uncharacterized membrane protein YhhN
MTMIAVVLGFVCVGAGIASAFAEVAAAVRISAALKMLAATAYIAFALLLGATASLYGVLILLALALSWIGDLFLIPHGRPDAFRIGIASFLLAHLVYAYAFIARGVRVVPTVIGAAVMLVFAIIVWRWLSRSDVATRMASAVQFYLLAIGIMVAFAAGTAFNGLALHPFRFSAPAATPDIRLLAGAVAFVISDLFVARERFVDHNAANRIIGLPLYFVAQILIASTI